MTKDEALRMALDALGTCRVMAADKHGNYTREVTPKVVLTAIAALKAALEQEEEPVVWMVIGDGEFGEYIAGTHFEQSASLYRRYWEKRGYELQPLYAVSPQPKQEEPCFCDRTGLGEPGVSCGDCPTRDYKPKQEEEPDILCEY